MPLLNLLQQKLGRPGPVLLGLLLASLLAHPLVAQGPKQEPGKTIDETDPEWWELRTAQIQGLAPDAYRQRAAELLATVTTRGALEALRLLEQAVEEHPEEATLWSALAEARIAPYRWTWDRDPEIRDRARQDLARAQEMAPGSPEVLRVSALLAMIDGRLEEAEMLLRQALEKEESAEVLRALGSVLRILDRHREAYFILDRAIRAAPGDWRGYWALGDVYRDDRWYEEALIQYRLALQLNRDAFPPKFGQILVYQRYGHKDMALEHHKEVLSRYPDFRNLILFSAALVQMEMRQHEKALALMDEVAFGGDRGLCQGSVLYRQAVCHRSLGDADRAVDLFRRVIDAFPRARDASDFGPRVLFDASRQLGALLEARGEPSEAMKVLEAAGEEPDAPLWLHLDLAAKLEAYSLHERAAATLRAGIVAEGPGDRLDERLRLRVDLARALRAAGAEEALRGEAIPALTAIGDEVRGSAEGADLYWLAKGYALAGDAEEAIAWLSRAIVAGYRAFDAIRTDEDLAAIRDEPGYLSLLEGR